MSVEHLRSVPARLPPRLLRAKQLPVAIDTDTLVWIAELDARRHKSGTELALLMYLRRGGKSVKRH